ncbi:MAG: glycoside hydrolase family 3 protein, partial [Chitinophagaceae bacterium]
MNRYRKVLILTVITGALSSEFCLAQQMKISGTDAVTRAQKIVAQMSLDEKTAQLHGIQDETHYRVVPGIPRLGIPALTITNGPAGFGPAGPGHQSKATALPAPISLAATWDTAAARRNGEVAGEESAAFGNLLLESPDVNIARTPHNGRTFEGYGEDPYLTGQIAVSYIKGVQSQGILANVKHFAGNNQEDNRFHVNAVIDERTLHEIYLRAFEAAVKEGHVASIMAAYNKLNGYHCTENDTLLTVILRKEWGFRGFVTSDFGAVHSTVPAALHGLDVELPTGKYWGNGLLKAAIESGQVPVSVIDSMLVRRYSTMMQYGVWNRPAPNRVIPANHAAIALHLATEGMVLLKNKDNMLPWKAGAVHSIALIGPFSAKAMTGGGGSSRVNPILTVSPVEGMQHLLGNHVKVFQYNGQNIDSAVDLARSAGKVVLMLGDFQSEGRDHPIILRGNQDTLAEAVLAANPNTVVVLKSGGPVLMPWVSQAAAILEAWYPGEEDGTAVAQVLFGKVNPSGKLPITFPKSDADLPLRTPE